MAIFKFHAVNASTLLIALLPPQDGSHAKRRMGLNREQMEAMNRVSLPGAVNGIEGPQRPTQLSLAPPSASTSASASAATSPSPTPSTPADSGPAATRLHFLLESARSLPALWFLIEIFVIARESLLRPSGFDWWIKSPWTICLMLSPLKEIYLYP